MWKNYEFHVNEIDCINPDYWFVFEGLFHKESAICQKGNLVFLTAEPPTIRSYNCRFLKHFGKVITCQRNIKHKNVYFQHQGHPWFVEKSYDELKANLEIVKVKNISIITSNKPCNDGHKKRIDFF